MSLRSALLAFLFSAASVGASHADDAAIRVLFLGDQGPHQPAARAAQLAPAMARRGIEIDYTENADDLNPQTLADYDGLIVYANIDRIEPAQEKALLEYVEQGGGFIPIHCASFCFRNSQQYVDLVGAQFQQHGTGVFRTRIAAPDHPLMRDFGGFESWDETYVHHQHNDANRTVLAYRVDDEGREPWTWVRTQGAGRVFYTAWGHDHRTFSNPGFQNLIERGIRWAVGADPADVPAFSDPAEFPVPAMTPQRTDVEPFKYVEARVPFYPPTERWGTLGEPITKMQQPLAPAESAKHMVVPAGFEARLFAADPDILKPICMAWDERGRLWVGETIDYPNELRPPGQGRDRIKICEDTDGDGRADKFTVFAEGLSIPTAITFHRGGVIVQDGTRTRYLRDTDGDDLADEERVLFEGWNMRDTHGGVSNFRYGLDNWIWAMQGYNQSRPTADGQPRQGFRMGFFRFRPDGTEVEFVRSTDNNTWGLGISEEGVIFGSTANHNPSVYMPIANRYYERVRGWSAEQLGTIADTHLFQPITPNVRQVDHHGGYTAGAGHALYTAREYPREYWNRTAFVCGPTGHLVGTFVLQPDGADFQSRYRFNLLASDDEWTAPIMAEVGPDGNVWVVDWYNYIVQHNPTPAGYDTGAGNAYETELRDKRHGRIYRVVYVGDNAESARDAAQPTEALSLADATPVELVATLAHPTMLWRLHAQRLLVERGQTDVAPALLALVGDRSVDRIGLNAGAIHALWTLHGLGLLDASPAADAAPALDATPADTAANASLERVAAAAAAREAVVQALTHPSAGVRRSGVLVLPRDAGAIADLLDAGLLDDPDAQVRLAALLALSEMATGAQAGAAIAQFLRLAENNQDRWLHDAATAAAAAHDVHFLQAVAGGPDAPAPLLEAASIVAEHLARSGETDVVPSLVAALHAGDPKAAAAVIAGLARGWPAGTPADLDATAERQLIELTSKLPAGAQGQLVRLAELWKVAGLEAYAREIATTLLKTASDEKQPEADRLAAARQLISFRRTSDETASDLLDQITPRLPPELAAGLIDTLALSQSDTVGRAIAERFITLAPSARQAALRLLLSRPAWSAALLDGISAGSIPLSDLSLDQQQALASHPNRDLARRARQLLERGGGLPNPDRQRVLDELLPLTMQQGDLAAGKEVFKKQCAKCHQHSGEGEKIGPDLTGMAVHPKRELLGHLIDPSRSVEGNYRVYSVVTADGRVLNGLLASETKTSIELIDAEAKRQIVLREDIDELVASPKSLMPEGFEKQVSPAEIVNLLEFLTHRGQFLPIPIDKAATIASSRGMFYSEDSGAERLVFADWSPKTFAGVPFQLVDPQGGRRPNVVLLYGPRGKFPPEMPKSVTLPCNAPAKAIHMLSGVSGWGFPSIQERSVSLVVRLHYADGTTEDHDLRNGVHFADYIRRVDVPGSEFAFSLRGQQIRYLSIAPSRSEPIEAIELAKGPDETAPIVMAVTVETR